MLLRVLALLFVFVLSGAAGAAPAIDWRVKHPFRFFTETTDFDMHREAFADVLAANGGVMPADAVLQLEQKLNDTTWLGNWYEANRTRLGTHGSAAGRLLYPDFQVASGLAVNRPERGWAHMIQRRQSTCWDWQRQNHSTCTVDTYGATKRTDYVRPQRHTVSFSLIDPPQGTCEWSAQRAIFKVGASALTRQRSVSCASLLEARIPFEPEKTEQERGVAVSVQLPDGSIVEAEPVWVRDYLVVGMGDSYSSGEGNPDSPVELRRYPDPTNYIQTGAGKPDHYRYSGSEKKLVYLKKMKALPYRLSGPASWLDRKCHRSIYSYHVRIALQVALADPKHSAVTLLGYACSGAELAEGMITEYAGKEHVRPGLFKGEGRTIRNWPQYDRLVVDLCADNNPSGNSRTEITNTSGKWKGQPGTLGCDRFARNIDLFVLSVGGNDVGFSGLIAEALMSVDPEFTGQSPGAAIRGKALKTLASVFGLRVKVDEARERAKLLKTRYAVFNDVISKLPFNKKAGKLPVILTAFPNFTNNENGETCGESGRIEEQYRGLNVMGFLRVNPETVRDAAKFGFDEPGGLFKTMQSAAFDHGWTFVTDHLAAFEKRGFCAHGNGSLDVFEYPSFIERGSVQGWSPLVPATGTRAYGPRQRWIRTFNDACLFVHFWPKGSPPPLGKATADDILLTCLGGPMHPTAEGHAAYTDAAYGAAQDILGLPEPTVEALRSR